MDNTLFFTARFNYIIQCIHASYCYTNGYVEFSAYSAYKACPLNDIDQREIQLLLDLMVVSGLLREGYDEGNYTFCFTH